MSNRCVDCGKGIHPEHQKADAEKAIWAEENSFILIVLWEHEIKEQGAWSLVHERILPLLNLN